MATEAAPVIGLGTSQVVERGVRGSLQGGTGYAIVEFIMAFNLYEFTPRQAAIASVLAGAAVNFIQNTLEQWRGRKLLGSQSPLD